MAILIFAQNCTKTRRLLQSQPVHTEGPLVLCGPGSVGCAPRNPPKAKAHSGEVTMSEKVLRDNVIKVRVTDAELALLRERMVGGELARWMRETCLSVESDVVHVDVPPVDANLLRQLAAIGNNVNQIARQVNSQTINPADAIQILTSLRGITNALHQLRDAHAG